MSKVRTLNKFELKFPNINAETENKYNNTYSHYYQLKKSITTCNLSSVNVNNINNLTTNLDVNNSNNSSNSFKNFNSNLNTKSCKIVKNNKINSKEDYYNK